MEDCCNAKTLSYVSAGLQIGANVILLLCTISSMASGASRGDLQQIFGSAELETTLFVIISAICLISLAFLVTLIVGLKQNRITLVKIYVYANVVVMVLYALNIFASFILGFLNQRVGAVFGKFFIDLLHFGLFILIVSPIFLHFKRIRGHRYMSVEYGYCNNQPIVPNHLQQ